MPVKMLSILLILATLPAFAQVPNGTLLIAYRQNNDGILSKSVHEMELSCWDASCSMTTITLNQCLDGADGKFFFPKAQRTSTEEGNLLVSVGSPGVLQVTESLGGTDFKYRFAYQTRTSDNLRREFKLKTATFFDGVTSFSGVAVRNSVILEKVVSRALVPLAGAHAQVTIDCPALLHGLPDQPASPYTESESTIHSIARR